MPNNNSHIRLFPPCEPDLKKLLADYEGKHERHKDVPLSNPDMLTLRIRRDVLSKLLEGRDIEKEFLKHYLWRIYKNLCEAKAFETAFERAWFKISEYAKPP